MKAWFFVFVVLLFPVIGFAQTDDPKEAPVPYEKEEFPLWLRDLGRETAISVGTFPIAYLVTSLIYDNAAGVNSPYRLRNVMLITAGISLTIALTDLIILNVVRTNREKKKQRIESVRQQLLDEAAQKQKEVETEDPTDLPFVDDLGDPNHPENSNENETNTSQTQ